MGDQVFQPLADPGGLGNALRWGIRRGRDSAEQEDMGAVLTQPCFPSVGSAGGKQPPRSTRRPDGLLAERRAAQRLAGWEGHLWGRRWFRSSTPAVRRVRNQQKHSWPGVE